MTEHELLNEMHFSMMTIIVNRGKGSKILKFAREIGAIDIGCLLGKGTINNRMLQIIEMSDVDKEIILIVVPTAKEIEILNQLDMKYNFKRKNQSIAFTMPLAGIMKMKRDSSVKWYNNGLPQDTQWDYEMIFVIVDKGKAEDVIQISQSARYYGGTIIKARGSSGKLNVVLDMIVDPEKEAVLMLMESKNANHLAAFLNEQLHLDQPNMGILVKIGVSRTIGLFQNDRQEEANDE